MIRIISFTGGQFFLFWLLSFVGFLSSENGRIWSSWKLGIRFDVDDSGILFIVIMLLSGMALIGWYYYFIKHWNRWREMGVVTFSKSTMLSTIPLVFLFFILNGFEPFFPIVKFFTHLWFTWYGLLRMITYLAVPFLAVTLLGFLFLATTEEYFRIFISILASFITIPVIGTTDHMVGGRLSGIWAYLNLPDSAIPVYITASTTLAYAGCNMILTNLNQRYQQRANLQPQGTEPTRQDSGD
ncbi:MAG: hypothetical protein HQM12_17885 [SAR324 cluster bacterium]|nr:hypothetical protein [SAR324 cluster bacterium]